MTEDSCAEPKSGHVDLSRGRDAERGPAEDPRAVAHSKNGAGVAAGAGRRRRREALEEKVFCAHTSEPGGPF
ncbi:hypothetical protein NDU88_005436 [Pleurodeles waltl]|uniref:Uncharacterized protein n=1 Tax=Pleurodeles waltl TaxID=8319 RepID=A0AAV7NP11_PLEWA|nr:hypothetical protein NDU88_005436 [Pleurodeles waltl]